MLFQVKNQKFSPTITLSHDTPCKPFALGYPPGCLTHRHLINSSENQYHPSRNGIDNDTPRPTILHQTRLKGKHTDEVELAVVFPAILAYPILAITYHHLVSRIIASRKIALSRV